VIATGGGRYDPDEGFCFFVAGRNIANSAHYHPWTLMGVDTLLGEAQAATAELHARMEAPDMKLMLDSGVFWLASRHGQALGMELYEALTTPPEQVDGWARLLERYVELVRVHEPTLWGYVELDQGTTDHKRATRGRLEDMGLRPIPVYHPMTDQPAYLDELLEGYDRVCIGNMAHADAATRRALLGMVWERRRRHGRRVWLHALGYTPNAMLNALPIDSADSSSHVLSLRLSTHMAAGRAMLAQFGQLDDPRYGYDPALYTSPERGLSKKVALLAWVARTELEAWRRQWADLERVLPGVHPWPPAWPGEAPPRSVAAVMAA
jgi:hypothetical protein